MLLTEQNHRRFIYYSMYGWGMPMIWTIFALCAAKYQFVPIDWAPNVGETTCFFSSLYICCEISFRLRLQYTLLEDFFFKFLFFYLSLMVEL